MNSEERRTQLEEYVKEVHSQIKREKKSPSNWHDNENFKNMVHVKFKPGSVRKKIRMIDMKKEGEEEDVE